MERSNGEQQEEGEGEEGVKDVVRRTSPRKRKRAAAPKNRDDNNVDVDVDVGEEDEGEREQDEPVKLKVEMESDSDDGDFDVDAGVEDEGEQEPDKPVKVKVEMESGTDDDGDDDDDDYVENSEDEKEDDDDDLDTKPPAKKQKQTKPPPRRSSRSKPQKGDDGSGKDGAPASKKWENTRGPKKDRTCPHCGKVCVSKLGLKYHVDHYVCRIEQCTDPEILKKKSRRKRVRSKGEAKSRANRRRGSLAERTCNNCGRVFTSVLGAEYHKKNKVCEKNALPSHQLKPGDRFVTKFGIVEVVKDDRATPSVALPANAKTLSKKWQAATKRIDNANSKLFRWKALQLNKRRDRINSVYENNNNNNNVNKKTVFQAYFGVGHPKLATGEVIESAKQYPPDPMFPEGSFPDRLVECILIPDNRSRFAGEDDKIGIGNRLGSQKDSNPIRLFLRRDSLTEEYIEENLIYHCADCGRQFLSLPGFRYHTQDDTCVQKKANLAKLEARKKEAAKPPPTEPEEELKPPPRARRASAKKPASSQSSGEKVPRWKKRVKKKKELGIYPECLITLGFQFVKEDLKITDDMIFKPELQDNIRIDPPEELLATLKKNYDHVRREADDQKYGAMYKGVFTALKYKSPRKRKADYGPGGTRKRRQKKEKPPIVLPPKPVPPLIDTQALADEVDSGRYPSLKRWKLDNADICCLCKNGGELLCCDFCKSSEHLSCIREKYTVKDPEPQEAFMCHKCIGLVLTKRRRAEKRRIEKQEKDLKKSQEVALEQSRKKAAIEKEGKEYEYMANKGQEVSELVELLQDATERLQQCLATTTMNNARRRMMGKAVYSYQSNG